MHGIIIALAYRALWDGANIVADIDGNNVSVYIRGINLIYADDGDKTYYHFNAHGDVVALTNESGNKTKSYSYNAFGVEYNEATLDDNPFRYCGEYYDKETQTIYLRARYYNPSQGRFTQEDPIRDGYNWYTYCGNNPIMFVDPTGKDAVFIVRYTKDDGLPIVGHASVLIEIEDGTWRHIQYTGKFPFPWTAKIRVHNDIYYSPEDLLDDFENEKSFYIEGDFSQSYEKAQQLKKNDLYYGGYRLFTNNCLHFSIDILKEGEIEDPRIKEYINETNEIIPDQFYDDLVREKKISDYQHQWMKNREYEYVKGKHSTKGGIWEVCLEN